VASSYFRVGGAACRAQTRKTQPPIVSGARAARHRHIWGRGRRNRDARSLAAVLSQVSLLYGCRHRSILHVHMHRSRPSKKRCVTPTKSGAAYPRAEHGFRTPNVIEDCSGAAKNTRITDWCRAKTRCSFSTCVTRKTISRTSLLVSIGPSLVLTCPKARACARRSGIPGPERSVQRHIGCTKCCR
jgi:hypothetical protein